LICACHSFLSPLENWFMKLSLTSRLLGVGVLVIATASLTSADLIVNGDFETGDLTGWTFTPAASGTFLGVVTLPPPDSTFGARFGATSTFFDSLSQTFATTPGELYDVSFFYQVGNTVALANNEFI